MVKTIVLGHSMVSTVSSDFAGQVTRMDVHHEKQGPEALLLLNGERFRVGIHGTAVPL